MSTITLKMGKARKPLACECCGAPVQTTHGFVYRDSEAFAVYQAAWSEGHPENQVNARIEIGGEWGDPHARPEHVFFGLLIYRKPEELGFSMLEPDESMWLTEETEGRFLSRAAALSHPLRSDIFHIAEHVAVQDKRIKKFLENNEIDG